MLRSFAKSLFDPYSAFPEAFLEGIFYFILSARAVINHQIVLVFDQCIEGLQRRNCKQKYIFLSHVSTYIA